MLKFRTKKARPPALSHPTKKIDLSYHLEEQEIYEGLRMLVDRRSPKSRRWMGAVLLLLAALCLVGYLLDPYGLQFALLGILLAVLSMLVWGYPDWKARRSAKKIARRKGTYRLTVLSSGYLQLEKERVDLFGDPDCRGFENDAVFLLRPDREHTVCIPKRALAAQQEELLREWFQYYLKSFVRR